MDYEKEFGKLTEGSLTFKPVIGVYNLTLMAEPEPTVYRDDSGNETPQVKIPVKEEGKDQTQMWFISEGSTLKSLYGQIMALGKYKGKLSGEKITLSVTSTKNKQGNNINSYSVLEAVKIMPELKKPTEETIK